MFFAVRLLYFFKIEVDPFYSIMHIISYLGGMALENGKQDRKHLIMFGKRRQRRKRLRRDGVEGLVEI